MEFKKWLYIDTGLGDAPYNMAVDEVLLNDLENIDLPILRLYTWERSLSFGRFSDIQKSIDIESVQNKKISYVRRMSGGGVLVHDKDISYSLVLPKKLLENIGVKESYRYFCGFLIKFYEMLGLDAHFASELNLQTKPSSICMVSNEAYDIVIDGKKIGGNAQRHTKSALFQHGSIPISINSDDIEDIFLKELSFSKLLTLDKMRPNLSIESLKKLILQAFVETFKTDLIKSSLSADQKSKVDELVKNKYSCKRWNIDAKHH